MAGYFCLSAASVEYNLRPPSHCVGSRNTRFLSHSSADLELTNAIGAVSLGAFSF